MVRSAYDRNHDPSLPCKYCGTVHVTPRGGPACAGHKKNSNRQTPCNNSPVTGYHLCRFHGGNTPGAKQVVATRAVESEADKHLARLRQNYAMGEPLNVGPAEALLREVRMTAGHVEWLRGIVGKMEEQHARSELSDSERIAQHPLVWGITEVKDVGAGEHPGTDTTFTASMSVWYVMYTKERQHLVAVTTAALKAGVEERRVRIAEDQGNQVASVIRRILDDLGLSAEQSALVPDVVPRHLRAIDGGAA